MNKVEPLVPLDELYAPYPNPMYPATDVVPNDAADYYTRKYGVTIRRDHRNREAVTLSEAYKIRDARIKAESEIRAKVEAEMHAGARIEAVYKARVSWLQRNDLRIRRSIPRGLVSSQEYEENAWAEVVEQALATELAAGLPEDAQRSAAFPPRWPFVQIEKPAHEGDEWYAYHLPEEFRTP